MPSLEVVGALRVIKDEPGVVAVVIFCDNIFKYTTSITKHCPQAPPECDSPNAARKFSRTMRCAVWSR